MPFTKENYFNSKKYDLFFFLNKKKINIFSSASLYEGKIYEFFNLLKIFRFLNQKSIFTKNLLDELKIHKISLPLSDHSLAQLFSVLNIISKSPDKIFPSYDSKIYKNSLNFVRSTKNTTSSLFGVDNLKQLNQNISILKNKKLSIKLQNEFWNVFKKY